MTPFPDIFMMWKSHGAKIWSHHFPISSYPLPISSNPPPPFPLILSPMNDPLENPMGLKSGHTTTPLIITPIPSFPLTPLPIPSNPLPHEWPPWNSHENKIWSHHYSFDLLTFSPISSIYLSMFGFSSVFTSQDPTKDSTQLLLLAELVHKSGGH